MMPATTFDWSRPRPRRCALIAFTEQGLLLAKKVAESLCTCGDEPWQADVTACFGPSHVSLADWAKWHFSSDDALVIVGSCGIAVRAIAPHVASKTSDPAVVVVDEGGHWCIPVLSGHIGGANRLATRVAQVAGATLVLTTATDGRGVWAVDTWAAERGLAIDNPHAIKHVSGKLLAGETIKLFSDVPLEDEWPAGVSRSCEIDEADVVISPLRRAGVSEKALWLIPRCVNVGIGCKRGKSAEDIESAWQSALEGLSGIGIVLDPRAVAQVRSHYLKADEQGLIEFCENHGWEFKTFYTEELCRVEGCVSPPSALVESVTGLDNVCERAALLGGGSLMWPKHAYDGVTVAVATGRTPLSLIEI